MPAIMLRTLQPSGIRSRVPSQAALPIAAVRRNSRMMCRAAAGEPKEDSDKKDSDSYAKIEAPVRGGTPDRGPPVSTRNYGQHLNEDLKQDEWNPDKKVLGTEVGLADALRFNGAVPEVANCRLAMLGFVLAVAGEAFTGRNVFQQVQHNGVLPVASVFVLIIIATLVPTVRGVPRKGNSIFSSDAEIINGRVAMVAFTVLVLMSFYQGSYLGTLASWFS